MIFEQLKIVNLWNNHYKHCSLKKKPYINTSKTIVNLIEKQRNKNTMLDNFWNVQTTFLVKESYSHPI